MYGHQTVLIFKLFFWLFLNGIFLKSIDSNAYCAGSCSVNSKKRWKYNAVFPCSLGKLCYSFSARLMS